MMTATLTKAFEAASRLPKPEQEEPANWILEEIGSERRWSELVGTLQKQLDRPASEALPSNLACDPAPVV